MGTKTKLFQILRLLIASPSFELNFPVNIKFMQLFQQVLWLLLEPFKIFLTVNVKVKNETKAMLRRFKLTLQLKISENNHQLKISLS